MEIILSEGICVKYLSLCFCILLILSLNGCSVKESPAPECVSDELLIEQTPAFYLSAELPQSAALTAAAESGLSSLFSAEDYTVFEEIFTAASLDEACLHISGRSAEALAPVTVNAFPQTEYRCAWTAAGENGPVSCNAALFYDGTHYYCLSVQCDTAAEKTYRDVFSDLLSSAHLRGI